MTINTLFGLSLPLMWGAIVSYFQISRYKRTLTLDELGAFVGTACCVGTTYYKLVRPKSATIGGGIFLLLAGIGFALVRSFFIGYVLEPELSTGKYSIRQQLIARRLGLWPEDEP